MPSRIPAGLISAACGFAALLLQMGVWAADAPPCSVGALHDYTPPMPRGTVVRTPGQIDWALTAPAGQPSTSPATNPFSSQQAAVDYTTQLLIKNAETETATWGVDKFYESFCHPD